MGVDEQFSYLPRLLVIIFASSVIAIIFLFGIPQLDDRAATAEIIAGSILYNGGLGEAGVIHEDKLVQSTADNYLISSGSNPLKHTVIISVYDTNDNQVGSPVIYNKNYYDLIIPAKDISPPDLLSWRLPVVLKSQSGYSRAYAVVEVLYAP